MKAYKTKPVFFVQNQQNKTGFVIFKNLTK